MATPARKIMVEIPADALDVLRRSTFTATTVALPPGQLDRALYVAVNKALEAAGGKWNRGQRVHVFASDPRAALGLAVETGQIEDRKQTFQAFYTPAALAHRMVVEAGVKPGMTVLEPSAGHGAILKAIDDAGGGTFAVELDPESCEILRKDGWKVLHKDFLATTLVDFGGPRFEAIIMNPPFSRDQDIEHVWHALKMLEPGGTLVSIMSPGFLFGETAVRRGFRFQVQKEPGWDVIELPEGSFKESGTDVRTVMVVYRKPKA